MLFSLDDLRAALGEHTLDHGRRLVDQGLIPRPNVQRGGELVTGTAHHGRSRPWRVYVKVRRQAVGLTVQGECSCREGRNCEHVAGLLLMALESDVDASADGGPGSTARPPAGAALHTGRDMPRLVYLLTMREARGSGLRPWVEIFAAGVRADGGYREPRRYLPRHALRGVPPRFLSADDLRVLRQLARRDSTTGEAWPVDRADTMAIMLTGGRCHFEDLDSPPLRQGEARAARLRWRLDGHGVQWPEWRTESGRVQVLELAECPWYLDSAASRCGALETGLPLDLLAQLSEPGGVAPERAAALREFLESALPDDPKALPRALKVETLPPVAAVPCLCLESRLLVEGEDGNVFDQARLTFDYHGLALAPEDPPSRLDGDRVLRTERDTASERACVERLLSLGFVARSATDAHGLFHLPGGRAAWCAIQAEQVPTLLDEGWRVEFAPGFRHRLARSGDWHLQLEDQGGGWFALSVGVDTEAGRVNLLPALLRLIRETPEDFNRQSLTDPARREPILVPLEDGRLLPVAPARLRPIFETLFELYEHDSLDGDGRLRVNRFQLMRLTEWDEDAATENRPDWLVPEALRQRLSCLRELAALPLPPLHGLQAQLRDYQRDGLKWLQFLRAGELAGILADDMGLGKTLQTLAHVLLEKEQGRLRHPALVVAPTSLMVNWRNEARRFAPDLRVLTLHGPDRHKHFPRIAEYDLVLTTYPLLARDQERLQEKRFHLLILDEAQLIKNHRAKASRAVRALRADHRLCLTGTPMENHLGELWSLFDFLLPGLLGTRRQFQTRFRVPVENQRDEDAARRLARRVRPFMLRRTKAQVVAELPPKTEILRSVELEGAQRDLYESIRLSMHERVRMEVEKVGLARSGIVIIDSLLKLRQVCCDPRLVKLDSARQVRESAKLDLLMTLLPDMVEEGRRILVFSQFTAMLDLIGRALDDAGLPYVRLTGDTRDRATPVERFQAGEVPLFLISLKAGGVGLNLTAADTVIHYDPWWNPAAERQATDRAHRIGQDKPVFVYKLISENTVEARIQALQARKQALMDGLLSGDGQEGAGWNADDLAFLFEPLG